MTALDHIKSNIKANLADMRTRYPIANLAIFGSVTRKDFNTEKSDVDILVEFDGDIGWEFFDLQEELQKIVGRKVDLVSRRGVKPRYWQHIKNDLIYV